MEYVLETSALGKSCGHFKALNRLRRKRRSLDRFALFRAFSGQAQTLTPVEAGRLFEKPFLHNGNRNFS